MPDVNCTVNNCRYWYDGNMCTAKHIIVQNDAHGGVAPDAIMTQLAATPATSEDETCCQTFLATNNRVR